MKKSSRIISVLLTLSILSGVLFIADFGTLAGTNGGQTETADIFSGYSAPDLRTRSAALPNLDYIENNYSEIINLINEQYKIQNNQIYLYDYKITPEELNNIVIYINNRYLNYFVESSYNYNWDGTYIGYYMPQYNMAPEKVEKCNSQIENEVNKAVKAAAAMKTDIEKIMYVHDYLVDTIDYDNDGANNQNNIYGALFLHSTMCVGYSSAFTYILGKLGIKSYIVTSDSLGHAWNLVYLDGKYYNVDCTWDDPTISNINLMSDPLSGYGRYLNFMCSDTRLYNSDHNSSDWMVNGYSAKGYAVSETYDSFFWRDYESLNRYSDGFWYHDYSNEYSGTVSSIGFSVDKIKFIDNIHYTIETVRTISTYWQPEEGYFYPDFYSTIQNIDNSVYYMKADGIYRLNPNGNTDGSEDILIFKNPGNDNIYDFDIDVQNGTFSVIYGKTYDMNSNNSATVTYNCSDYFCKTEGHRYKITAQTVKTKETDGYIEYTCSACTDKLIQTDYCYKTMKRFLQLAINSKSGEGSFNASVDYNKDGIINTRDFHLLRQEFAEYL